MVAPQYGSNHLHSRHHLRVHDAKTVANEGKFAYEWCGLTIKRGGFSD